MNSLREIRWGRMALVVAILIVAGVVGVLTDSVVVKAVAFGSSLAALSLIGPSRPSRPN